MVCSVGLAVVRISPQARHLTTVNSPGRPYSKSRPARTTSSSFGQPKGQETSSSRIESIILLPCMPSPMGRFSFCQIYQEIRKSPVSNAQFQTQQLYREVALFRGCHIFCYETPRMGKSTSLLVIRRPNAPKAHQTK